MFTQIDMKKLLFLVALCAASLSATAQTASDYLDAANKGDVAAQVALGECYEKGLGVSKDERIAFQWYKKAAKQGSVEAQYKIGQCYKKGNEWLAVDFDTSLEWIRKSAKQGYAPAER